MEINEEILAWSFLQAPAPMRQQASQSGRSCISLPLLNSLKSPMSQLCERSTVPQKKRTNRFLQRISGFLASSFIMSHGRRLFELNQKNWHLPLSKFDKICAGGYVILKDYSQGTFPPTFDDQAQAYEAEMRYMEALPGTSFAQIQEAEMRKPFWGSEQYAKYSQNFHKLLQVFEELGLKPKSRILELGCGTGWMAEFLALSGYSVVGTSIAPNEIDLAKKRAEALRLKGFNGQLSFVVSPMECVDREFKAPAQFDGVFVFEALHHAFDWRKAIRAAYNCLKPGGWLILAQEPNVLHTFVSYRVSKLAKTHEIGMSRKALVQELRLCAFSGIRIFRPKINNLFSHHWVASRR